MLPFNFIAAVILKRQRRQVKTGIAGLRIQSLPTAGTANG